MEGNTEGAETGQVSPLFEQNCNKYPYFFIPQDFFILQKIRNSTQLNDRENFFCRERNKKLQKLQLIN